MAFDLSTYKQQMKTAAAKYECLHVCNYVPLLNFVHKTLPPSLGAMSALLRVGLLVRKFLQHAS